MKQLLAVLLFTGFLEAKDNLYINPILPGSYPAPSICKNEAPSIRRFSVGGTVYLPSEK